MVYLKLRYRYWQHHVYELFTTVFAVALTIGLSAATAHLFIITTTSYKSLVLHPSGPTDLHLVTNHDEGMFAVWQQVLEDLPDIDSVIPVLSRQTLAVSSNKKLSVQVQGVDITQIPNYSSEFHSLKNTPYSIVISRALAKQLDIHPGEALELLTPRGFYTFNVIALSSELIPIARASLHDIQELFIQGNYVDGFDLRLNPTSQLDTVLNDLTQRFQGMATVITPEQRNQPIRQVLHVVWLVILMLFVCSLGITAGLLYSFLLARKSNKNPEENLLYTFGISAKTLKYWQVLEMNSIMVCAAVAGFTGLTLIHSQYPLHPISFLVAGSVGVLSIGLASYSSFLTIPTTHPPKNGLWLPTRIWLSWQFLVQLGKPYAIAVIILTIALTTLTASEIILQAQQRSLQALLNTTTKPSVLIEKNLHLQEEFPLEGKLTQTLRWNMAMLPGVTFVSSHLTKVMLGDTLEEALYVLDFATFPYQGYLQTIQGSNSDLSLAFGSDRRLAISQSLANSYKLKVGMHIRLHTPTGQHHYKVVAILKDLENISRAMFIDRRSYLQDWARSSDGLFVISLEESSRPKQIAGLLQEHLSQRYKGLSWAALSFKSDLDLLMSKLLLSCRWLMVFFVLIALGLLYNLLSGAATNQLFSTLYLLGGQHHLLRRLGEHSILFTTTVIMVVSLALGTSLGYVLVGNLNPISNYWSWGLTGQSYAPTVVILLVLLMVLSRALQRAIPRFSRKLPGR